MRPIVVQVGPLAASSGTAVAASQSVTAPNSVVLNGSTAVSGVAILDKPRQVSVISAGNDSGITFTVVGTNWSGAPITEVITGANAGTALSVLDYATVTRVTPSGSTAAAITIGTTSVAGSAWMRVDDYGQASTVLQHVVSGTANGTVQTTLDDPNSVATPVAPIAITWLNHPDPTMQGFTASCQGDISTHVIFARVLLNSGSGSITTTYLQGGAPAV